MSGVWDTHLTSQEWEAYLESYRGTQGIGNVDLVGFVPFMHHLHPESLKRYRLWFDTVGSGEGLDDALPRSPVVSMILAHHHVVVRHGDGILAEIIAARSEGASRREVADLLALAWLHSGPFGMNVAAGVSDTYMRLWDAGPEATGVAWPEGWAPDPDAFRCGIDFATIGDEPPPAAADQAALVEAWYRRVEGEVPRWVKFMSKHYPLALMAFRARYETSTTGTLPAQMIALCQVHLSASWTRPEALRRALHMARYFGVAKAHVVQVLALAQLYLGDIGMDAAIDGADDALSESLAAARG
jgi:hypothetical protein